MVSGLTSGLGTQFCRFCTVFDQSGGDEAWQTRLSSHVLFFLPPYTTIVPLSMFIFLLKCQGAMGWRTVAPARRRATLPQALHQGLSGPNGSPSTCGSMESPIFKRTRGFGGRHFDAIFVDTHYMICMHGCHMTIYDWWPSDLLCIKPQMCYIMALFQK